MANTDGKTTGKIGSRQRGIADEPQDTNEASLPETEQAPPVNAAHQKLIDNPNLNQAGNDRGSHDEPETGSQTGADID